MFTDFGKAVTQFRDPKFTKTLFKSLFITGSVLFLSVFPFYWILGLILPETLTIPFVGTFHPEAWLSGIAIGFALFAMIFLMFPIAFLVVGFFLDDIAEAVEAKHYPHLSKVPHLRIREIIVDAIKLFFVMIFANTLAIIIYFAIPPFAPFIFYIVNGFLLGREYFQMVAMRRLGEKAATKMRKKFRFQIWLAGIFMAVPLSIPIVNILVPLLGVATFTHMFHRLSGQD
ncbi:MAG: EI24 domain-containing protein [Rhodobacteraceae bacterium]|nr:EI24 domain-containing protein [Paracoccaceae bacterium]